ncbi:hypothetical protein TWF694_008334 [Orbilia ellipsospora]|uniref:Extracellular membrane protein CFEM domain-containing protein n=1 Tax=Orbilia ellipsospora TaxID=2528407 RepID=A0AAV9XFS5_9PEZI
MHVPSFLTVVCIPLFLAKTASALETTIGGYTFPQCYEDCIYAATGGTCISLATNAQTCVTNDPNCGQNFNLFFANTYLTALSLCEDGTLKLATSRSPTPTSTPTPTPTTTRLTTPSDISPSTASSTLSTTTLSTPRTTPLRTTSNTPSRTTSNTTSRTPATTTVTAIVTSLSNSGPPVGAIAGGTIGGIAVVVSVAAGIWFYKRRQRSKENTEIGGMEL